MPLRLLVFLLSLLGSCPITSPAQEAADRSGELHYSVVPRPNADACDLEVTLHFLADGPTSVLELPSCRYGTPRQWECVLDLEVEGGELRAAGEDTARRTLDHEPGAAVEVRYRLVVDPRANPGVAYRASVGPDHFHFFDSQWRVRVAGREAGTSLRLEVRELPEGWTGVSNLGAGPGPWVHELSRSGANSGAREHEVFLAGGRLHSAHFALGERPVAIHLRGFAEADEVLSETRAIVEALGERFGEFEGSHYVVSLFPRERIRAGTAIENAFVCLLNPLTDPVQRRVLVAHEFFHNWLPRTASILPARDGTALDEFRFDWFLEGFTEYVARRVLLDAGFVSEEEFVRLFDADLAEQERNPQKAATLEEVRAAIAHGAYTNHHERTSYFRGPLIACAWDHALRTTEGTDLLEVIEAFVEEARAADGSLGEDEFFELLETFGLDARGAYERHVVEGIPPNLPEKIFGPEDSIRRRHRGSDASGSAADEGDGT